MRNTLVLAILTFGLVAFSGATVRAGEHSGKHHNKPATQPATQPAQKAKYVCPMGCATSDQPGKCPKCGMSLVPADDAK